MIVSLVKNTT